jgi:hypothetical protein
MPTFRGILAAHARRYPRWEAADRYKLTHRAAFGNEHALPNPEAVRAYLDRELAGLGDGPDQPLLDPIRPDGALLRVHLRALVARKLSPDALFQAFLKTAHEYRGSGVRTFRAYRRDALMGGDPAARRLFDDLQAQGLPAIHHSDRFRTLYKPAYRVVASRFLPAAWLRETRSPRDKAV